MSSTPKKKAGSEPRLLSGGNPQIPKADGDPPVQAYIEAMPGWKREVGQEHVRYLDIYESGGFDESQLTKWIEQAAHLPGETLF